LEGRVKKGREGKKCGIFSTSWEGRGCQPVDLEKKRGERRYPGSSHHNMKLGKEGKKIRVGFLHKSQPGGKDKKKTLPERSG